MHCKKEKLFHHVDFVVATKWRETFQTVRKEVDIEMNIANTLLARQTKETKIRQ